MILNDRDILDRVMTYLIDRQIDSNHDAVDLKKIDIMDFKVGQVDTANASAAVFFVSQHRRIKDYTSYPMVVVQPMDSIRSSELGDPVDNVYVIADSENIYVMKSPTWTELTYQITVADDEYKRFEYLCKTVLDLRYPHDRGQRWVVIDTELSPQLRRKFDIDSQSYDWDIDGRVFRKNFTFKLWLPLFKQTEVSTSSSVGSLVISVGQSVEAAVELHDIVMDVGS